MAATYVLIASNTVGAGGTSTITFSSIPSTYTDLKLVSSSRTTQTGNVWAQGFIRFNGDTSSSTSYSNRQLYGTGSAAASDSDSSVSRFNFWVNSDSATTSTFSNSEIYIPNYLSSTSKSASHDGVAENNATSAIDMMVASLYSTSSAISSIVITPTSGNFMQYSTFYLYGISKS